MGNDLEEQLDKRALQKKLTEARLSIMIKYPFFGCLVMGLKLGFANIETAATDMKRILWDPQFLAKLKPEEVEFVMMHEVMHCVLKHCMRGKDLEAELYNVACDIVVNSTILDYMGIKDFKVDGELVMHKTPLGDEGHLYTAEQVYKLLQMVQAGQGGNTNGNQPGGSSSGQSGGMPGNGTLDNHGVWANVHGNDKYLQEEWKDKLLEALNGGKNYAPNGTAMRKLVEDYINEGKVDWKTLLNQFIQVVYDTKDYTFSPYDRRFADTPFLLPAFNEVESEKMNNLWFVVDASGSISDSMLGLIISEIRSAIRQFESLSGSVSFFDTRVSEPLEFEDELVFPSYGVLGGGGTSFHAIFEYMKENMSEELPAAAIILTDGMAPYPPEDMAMGVPVLWILINADEDAPWGVSVRIEE